MHIAVLGSGLSGSICALMLAERGHRVDLFDEQAEPLLEVELAVLVGPVELFLEGTGKAVHPHLGELLEGLFGRHDSPFS